MRTFLAFVIMAAGLASISSASAQSADLSQVMIDVSSHNDLSTIIPHLQERQIELVVMRATIGLGTPDKTFDEKVKMLRAHSPATIKGAYHALYPGSGRAQALEFLSTVKKTCQSGESFILAVDWERPSKNKAVIDPATALTVDEFVQQVESSVGKKPLIYTGPDVIAAQRPQIASATSGSPLWLSTYYSKLYLARQCSKETSVQNGFTCANSIHGLIFPDKSDYAPWQTWKFWQFSSADKGDPAFIRTTITKKLPVDVSFFGGSREEFRNVFLHEYLVGCDQIIV